MSDAMTKAMGRLAENLAFLRGQKGMSREVLSQAVGVEEGVLAQLEQGECPLSFTVEDLLKTAAVLEVEPDKLFISRQ